VIFTSIFVKNLKNLKAEKSYFEHVVNRIKK